MTVFAAAALLPLVGCLGDAFLRKAGMGEGVRWGWLSAAALCYLGTIPGWFWVMRHMKFPVLGAVSSVSSVLALALVGILVFKDSVTHREAAGIVLAVCSLVLLSKAP